MKYRDIQPGMRVRVRQWDDMAGEDTYIYDRIFAGDNEHPPAERNCFLRSMEGLCGMEFTVTSFGFPGSPAALNGHDFRKNIIEKWVIEPWMVEPVYEEEEITAPESFDLSDLLAPNPDANGGVGT